MSRRLNPELFNDSSHGQEDRLDPAAVVVNRRMEKELRETKKRLSHLESLFEVVQSQMKTMSEAGEKRTSVFSQAIRSLEKDLREQDLEQARSIKRIEGQLKSQQVVEGQIESMVDRFNTSLAHFENKLASLKNVLSEREMTLISYRQLMEQIVDEVEKMKSTQRTQQRSRPNFL